MLKFTRDDPSIVKFYEDNGYVVISDLIDRKLLELVRRQILSIFEIGFNEPDGGDELLVNAYNDDRKEVWRNFAKRMAYVPALMAAAGAPSVYDTLQSLGLKAPIVSTYPEVRTDMPHDIKYQQPWHQDWRSGQGSMNSVTIWTPLHDMRAELGPMVLLPTTHKDGLFPYQERLSPRAFVIDEENLTVSVDNMIQALLPFGDSAIFSQMLVHRSMNNTSNDPRLTFQLRYADLFEEEYKKNHYKAPTGSELVWDAEPLRSKGA